MDPPRNTLVFGGFVVVVVALAFGALTAGGSPGGSPVAQAGNSTASATAANAPSANATAANATTANATTGAACDYSKLYDRTIDSVVLVSHGGGQGSGFVYSVSGNESVVVTNQHVVGQAEEVTVAFRRGERLRGEVIGTASGADLAAVRVNGTPGYVTDLPVADSAPDPGTKVAAMGAPFGLRGTITHGIVSSTNRSVPTQRGFLIPDVIQTDAPINPGNSGGPLVTCGGTVVGINTAGIPAGRAENVGFAVSSSLVQRVVPQLVETGEFTFPFLGVGTAEVTPAMAEAMGFDTSRGVMVVRTVEGGPAEGVLQGANQTIRADGRTLPVGGDVILAIEGRPVRSSEDLSSYLATEASPGEQANLTVFRDGQRRTVTVELGERPALEAN